MKFLVIILIVSISACNTLDIVESKPINDDVQFARYDSDSKIRYNVYNNSAHLKVVFSTNDKAASAKILKGGLTVYFDDQNKKKETTFVTFPIESELPEMNSGNTQTDHRPPDLIYLIRQIPNAKVYSFQDSQQHLAIHEGDIETKIYSKGEELFYELLIPLERISSLPKADLPQVNIGVISGTLEMPEGRGTPSGGMNGGGGPPERGSMNGGGSQPGGRGGPPSNGDRPDMDSMSSPIDFWFTAVLN